MKNVEHVGIWGVITYPIHDLNYIIIIVGVFLNTSDFFQPNKKEDDR